MEKRGPILFILFIDLISFFRVWFSGDIDEVMVMMMHWNKVFLVFLYLDDVHSGTDDGQMGVDLNLLVRSL